MQWIIAINDAGPAFAQYSEMARVAVFSALERTSLTPIVIYDGGSNDFTSWLRRHGVRVIRWRSSLYPELRAIGATLSNKGFVGALPGIFLRVDLPVIGQQFGLDDYVLYTDCDVMFAGDGTDLLQSVRCRYFAAAVESDRSHETNMNSGVMWMHLPGMLTRQAEFLEFIRAHREELPEYWDQGCYSRFYRSECGVPLWDTLPPELNWKPYWESSADARIIHFHGPKPFQQPNIATHYAELSHLTGGCYSACCEKWRSMLARADKQKSTAPEQDRTPGTAWKRLVGTIFGGTARGES